MNYNFKINFVFKMYDNEKNDLLRHEPTFITETNTFRGIQFGYKSLASFIESGTFFNRKTELLIFHTVIFCDFRIRMLGDRLHRHTVQCVVPLNIFTEKMFTILWFWLFLLNFLNFYNLIRWISYFTSFNMRTDYIKKHLFTTEQPEKPLSLFRKSTNNNTNSTARKKPPTTYEPVHFSSKLEPSNKIHRIRQEQTIKIVNEMTQFYLMHDSFFVLKLISNNINEMAARELISFVTDNYRRNFFLSDPNEDTV
jgi:hypothetical protein